MAFTPFALVEWQSRHEPSAAYSLADSGCHPARLTDVVDDRDELERLLAIEQGYGAIAGAPPLRERIAAWHAALPADVLVAVGGTEANAIVLDALVPAGARVAVVSPGYPQLLGSLLNRGAEVELVALDPVRGWRLDPSLLDRAVRPGTRAIVLTNPNNPTGAVLTGAEMDAIVAAADRVGAWIVADEVHRGTELEGPPTPTFWGRYDRVVCTGSMSKAFGLPGLRIGWVIAPPALREPTERRHEYATIAPARLSALLAERALGSPVRERLLERTRGLLRAGRATLRAWVDASEGLVSLIDPVATAAGFVRYAVERSSLEIADALRTQAGVLVIPGVHFGVEQHLRITHGLDPAHLKQALQRIASVLRDQAARAGSPR